MRLGERKKRQTGREDRERERKVSEKENERGEKRDGEGEAWGEKGGGGEYFSHVCLILFPSTFNEV